MKSIKKLLLTAGIVLQLSSGLHADAWSDAFAAFGGKANIYNNRKTMSWSDAKDIAEGLGNTPEAVAVAVRMSRGGDGLLEKKSRLAYESQAALDSALSNAPVAGPAKAVPFAQADQGLPVAKVVEEDSAPIWNWGMGNAAAPAQEQAPVEAAPQAERSSLWNWIGSAPTQPVVTQADVENAQKLQMQADADKAAQADTAMSLIVNSNNEGAALYIPMVDLVLDNMRSAVYGIEDAAVQQQVINHIKNKASSMKVVSGSNLNGSKTLGRMNSSKKASKKNRRK